MGKTPRDKQINRQAPALLLGLYQILGGEKSLKALFLIKVGQNWVINGGAFFGCKFYIEKACY